MIKATSDKEKYYYKIGELEKITGISSSKIRYWTNNHEILKNQLRSTEGYTHKLYHHNAIEIIINFFGQAIHGLHVLSSERKIVF